jgi:Gly-Xaa carboxypeptidase
MLLAATIFLCTHIAAFGQKPWSIHHYPEQTAHQCPQVAPLLPTLKSKELEDMDNYIKTSQFRNESVARLSGAVKIPTMSYDDPGPIGEDKRWEIFYDFASYLKDTFPLVHERLDLEMVNTHGLIYTWNGADENLKPTLLMAHQDVVPVPESTMPQWTHPPFDGVYDGKYIWGRGASDCKNQLIAEMEAIELLLQADFHPKRTIVLAYGFDEEVSGPQGAGHIAPVLLERYGKDGVAAIVDEGAGISTIWDTHFATPGVAEKGYIDVEIVVRMPGGHSSIPPAHNGIGVMSQLITSIEAHPYEPTLADENPFILAMQCGARYSSNFPKKLKKLLPGHKSKAASCSKKQDRLALEASKLGPAVKYLMTTSVAVDVIEGGVKVNALPERTVAIVNHRVNVGEHPSMVKDKLTALAKETARKYNLTVHAFNDEKETPSSITLIQRPNKLEPAPVTPTDVDVLSAYGVLSGTTRAVYGEQVIMAPGIMTGNTDTRYYWDVSRNIFRFVPGWDPEDTG